MMKRTKPPFRADHVGSLLRPAKESRGFDRAPQAPHNHAVAVTGARGAPLPIASSKIAMRASSAAFCWRSAARSASFS